MTPPVKRERPAGNRASSRSGSGKQHSSRQRTDHAQGRLRRAALAATRAGVNVLPPKEDESKAPDGRLVNRSGRWHALQGRRVTEDEIARWYSGDRTGMGVVCGAVSGGLEMLEFEGRAVDAGMDEDFVTAAHASGLGPLVDRIAAGYLEMTPSGGYHLLYRCPKPDGSEALARRPATEEELAENPKQKTKVLMETRGEGGYVVTAPSHGAVHETGMPYVHLMGGWDTIVTISDDERTALLNLARSFDRLPPKQAPAQSPEVHGVRPGDVFNEKASWATDVLEPAGWTHVHDRDGVGYWCRPGKAGETSATVNHDGHDMLYVFSTSTPFPEVPAGYTKFSAYVYLHHDGDFPAAATALHEKGYRADSKRPDRDRFYIQSMDEVETRPIRWLWDGYIPFGKLTTAEGDPEGGKSLVSTDLAARGSTGRAMPDGATLEPFATLLLCDEDDYEDTVAPRLKAAGADLKMIYALFVNKDAEGQVVPFVIPDDMPVLEGAINALMEATDCDRVLVIVDPATSYLSQRINSNNDASVRQAMSPLAALARDTGAALLLVRHLNKNSGEKNHKYRGGGSIAFFAAARASLMFGTHPDDPTLKVMVQAKKNIAKARPSLGYRIASWDEDPDQPIVVWEGAVDLDASTVLNGRDARTMSPDRDEAASVIHGLVEDGGGQVVAGEAFKVCADLGISKSTVKRAVERLGLVKERVRTEDGKTDHWLWKWPVAGSKVRINVQGVGQPGSPESTEDPR